MTGWLCNEVGTTRYSPVADVPHRSGRLNNHSFHYTSVLVSSTRFLSEACLAAPSRLALVDQGGEPLWRGSVGRLPLWDHHWSYPNGTTLPKKFRIAELRISFPFSGLKAKESLKHTIRNSQFEIPNFLLVDLTRLERATSTFAESRSNSIELQILKCPICFSLS